MNGGAGTRVYNLDLSTTSVGGLYRFLGGVNQLDRGFEGLDRAQQSIAAKYRADGGKPRQTVSRHPNLHWTVGRVPPGATGKAGSISDGRWIAQNCWKRGCQAGGRQWTFDARTRPVLVWPVVEFFNYRLMDKLSSIGYFRKQRAVGFREPDVKTFLIVCNTFPAKLSRI